MEGCPELTKLWSLSAQSPDCPHLYHQLRILSLVSHEKNWQESLKAGILMIMVYYREKIHIKISQRKRSIGQTLEEFWMLSFCCPQDVLPSWCFCVTAHEEYWQPESSSDLSIQSFYWGFILQSWLIDCIWGWEQFPSHLIPCGQNLLLSVMWLVFLVWSAPIQDYQVWPFPPSDPGWPVLTLNKGIAIR